MTAREQLKTLAAQSPDENVDCVACNDTVKGKNLVRHFDTNHAPFIDAMTENEQSGGHFECETVDSGAFIQTWAFFTLLPFGAAMAMLMYYGPPPIPAQPDELSTSPILWLSLTAGLMFVLFGFLFVANKTNWWRLRLIITPQGIEVRRNLCFNRSIGLPVKSISVGPLVELMGDPTMTSAMADNPGLIGYTEQKRGMYMKIVTGSGSLTVRSRMGSGHFERQWASQSFTKSKRKRITMGLTTIVTLSVGDFIRLQAWLCGRGALTAKHPAQRT